MAAGILEYLHAHMHTLRMYMHTQSIWHTLTCVYVCVCVCVCVYRAQHKPCAT